MANYKRVISYMYVYRNQLKGNNVGFARIETRGNECKITLHIRVSNMKDQEIRGYIYCWYGKELHGVYIGDIHISNGVGELVVKTDIDNMMNTKYRFSEMGGILLFASEAQYIATEWDGKAVLFDTLKIDTVKPADYFKRKEEVQKSVSAPVHETLAAAETAKKQVQAEEIKPEALKEETAAAVATLTVKEVSKQPVSDRPLPEPKVVKTQETEQAPVEAIQTGKSLDEVIEDQVAVKEQSVTPLKEEKTTPPLHITEQPEDRPGSFPLSQEKMENLDKQAQELFGTMLMNTLFPPEKENSPTKEQQVVETKKEVPKEEQPAATALEPEEKLEQSEPEAPHILTINPKTAIECFTAFRGCESEEEYKEIQEEIQTMHAEIKHLESLLDTWKIKQARIKEMEMAKEEERLREEEEKIQLQEKIREEYHIDGIQGELEAAQIKHALTERIFDKYPKIEPFEDTAVEQCVRIEPQDLGIFPMENWILANNSFLLHGYYSYRHLIFVMEQKDGVERYLLGVPGVNYSRERFMANMFGFTDFKTLRSEDNESGEFGYWCHEIVM